MSPSLWSTAASRSLKGSILHHTKRSHLSHVRSNEIIMLKIYYLRNINIIPIELGDSLININAHIIPVLYTIEILR